MPISAKTIRTRIKSIKNTSKITKAMELVSASKMRRDAKLAEASRAYDISISDIINNIMNVDNKEIKNEKREKKEKKNIAIVVFSSNRGLCGSFNSQVMSFAKQKVIENFDLEKTKITWICVGKKVAEIFSRNKETIEAQFAKIESNEDAGDFFNIGKFLYKEFGAGTYDEVWLVYMDFVSSMRQIPRFNRLLPLETEKMENKKEEYIFEPDKNKILSFLIPRFIETKMYQALLESNASEHSSRMVAMKNASDACRDLTEELVFQSNEVRQSSITREVSEIAGAKSAIEQF